MTEEAPKRDLEELYSELRRFAPSEAVDDLAQLADRLQELRTDANAPDEYKSTLDAIWSSVEKHLDER